MPSNSTHTLLALALLTAMQFQTVQDSFALNEVNGWQESGSLPSKSPNTRGAVEMLTDAEGVNFDAFMSSLYKSIKNKWLEGLPAVTRSGQQGKNSVQFRVMRDGKVPEDSIKLVFSSENKDLDDASLSAVRKASPFNALPMEFSQPSIELRIRFYYNTKK